MNRALVCAIGSLVALASCGKFLEATGNNPSVQGDAGAADGAGGDGGDEDAETAENVIVVEADAAAPAKPLACPLVDCPEDAEVCKDDACDANRDFQTTGVVTAAGGTCTIKTNTGSSVMFHTYGRPAARTHAVLALKVLELQAITRTIARISIQGAASDERFIVRLRNGAIELCEQNASGTRCAPPLGVTFPQTLHLFGIVTSSNPPNATFALATNANACSAVRVLDVTAPFPAGDLRGEVGCVGDGAQCVIEFDDALFLVRPE